MANKQENSLIEDYRAEYNDWLRVLQPYHNADGRFSKNYRQYTAYTDTKGTHTKISDPMAPQIIEQVIQKLFERDPKFFALARGKNIPKEIINIISATAEFYWTSPEVIQKSGTRKAILKVFGREFMITGNGGTETFFNNESDTPDFRVIPIEDVIFDPTKTLKTSPIYYIRQFVSLDWLKKKAEEKKGGEVVNGLFKNIPALERSLLKENEKKTNKEDNSPNRINRSGSTEYDKKVDEIELISRWEGQKVCQIANWEVIVREADDPMQIGDDPLDFAMDIEVPKEPYAFGILDSINGLIKAKDLFLNQLIDYGSKVLNPPLFVDPSLNPVNQKTLRNAYQVGGIVMVPPSQAEHKPMPSLGNFGFEMLGYLQQRGESVSGIGPYNSGVPNQESDKTQGTKGGIEALIQQATSPIKDRQQNIEESIIEPVVNKWLKMAGNLMGENEIKYVFITGESPKWIRITKGLLTGKITLTDLAIAELISTEPDPETGISEAQELASTMIQKGLNPETDVIFDVDWIVRVETGSMAEQDKQKDLENFDSAIKMGMELGVPIDIMKAWKERAIRAGIKEPEQYLQQQLPAQPMPGQENQGMPQGMPQGGQNAIPQSGQQVQVPVG